MAGLSSMKITASHYPSYYRWLPALPWGLPLEEWPEDLLANLPRGISRHVVRFVDIQDDIFAVKEISDEVAAHEYEMLQKLKEAALPVVRAAAVVAERKTAAGEELPGALVTRHLRYSLPYRMVISQHATEADLTKVIDSLVVLLVKLHLAGFYWGDMSLSNTLFRRDAGTYAAYLVDAETGRFYDSLTVGQREWDLELGRTNIIGEMMDLQAGDLLPEELDVVALGDYLAERYCALWADLTETERIAASELWRISNRIERLQELGFDVEEIYMDTDSNGDYVRIRPKVVESGHYHKQVMRLTGLQVQESQAKRIYNDILTYRKVKGLSQMSLEQVAVFWMEMVYLPTVEAVPKELRGKLEPAELMHQVLEHRWYLSEQAGHHIRTKDAVADYIREVLPHRKDENVVVLPNLGD